MRAIHRILLGLGAFSVVNVTVAWACSCAPASAQDLLEAADLVVVGEVTRSRNPAAGCLIQSSATQFRSTVSVEAVLKGTGVEVGDALDLRHVYSGATCGVDLDEGERWLLYLTRRDGELETSLCTGSGDVGDASLEEIGDQVTGTEDSGA